MEVEVISIYFWTLPNLAFKSQTHWVGAYVRT